MCCLAFSHTNNAKESRMNELVCIFDLVIESGGHIKSAYFSKGLLNANGMLCYRIFPCRKQTPYFQIKKNDNFSIFGLSKSIHTLRIDPRTIK